MATAMTDLKSLPFERKRIAPARVKYAGRSVKSESSSPEYEIEISPVAVRTGRNYDNSLNLIPDGYRMSTAAETLAVQLMLKKQGQDPRKSSLFDNSFERNSSPYVFEWTLTSLLTPEGAEPSEYEVHGNEKYWARKVKVGERIVGEALIPEGNGGIVTGWNEVHGIPTHTTNKEIPYKDHDTHFWFNSELLEVAVTRRAYWHLDVLDRCLFVVAYYGRSYSFLSPIDGFRPVRGSLPEIRTIASQIPELTDEQFWETARSKLAGMTLDELAQKLGYKEL